MAKIHERHLARYILGFIAGIWFMTALSYCGRADAQDVVARGKTPDGTEYVLFRNPGICTGGASRAYKRERDGAYHWGCYTAETQYIVIRFDNGASAFVLGSTFKLDQFYDDEFKREQQKRFRGTM